MLTGLAPPAIAGHDPPGRSLPLASGRPHGATPLPRTVPRALAGAVLLALLASSIASAHAELDAASPGPDEVIAGAPTRLVARFTQDLSADRTSIEVRDGEGRTVARGGKDPDRERVQRVDLPALGPGAYEVRWVTYSSEDGELARGRYRFTIAAALATEAPTPGPSVACPSPLVPVPSPVAASAATLASPAPAPTPIPTPDPTTAATPSPIGDAVATLVPAATREPCATAAAIVLPPASPSASGLAASAEAGVAP